MTTPLASGLSRWTASGFGKALSDPGKSRGGGIVS